VPGPLAGLVPAADLQLLAGFHDYLRNGTEPHTPDTVRTYVNQLVTFFRLVPGSEERPVVESVTKPALITALAAIPHERTSTRRNMFFAVKALSRYLADMELLDERTAGAIAAMRIRSSRRPTRPHLGRDEIERVIQRLASRDGAGDHDRLVDLALFATLALTGLRNTELCRLRVGDVDLDGGLVHVAFGKGGKSRTVGLPGRLAPLLRAYQSFRPSTYAPTFFVGIEGQPFSRDRIAARFRRLSAVVGIKFTAHTLRRSFATDVVHNRGVPLDKLQVVLGHADIVTTRNYVQTSGNSVALEMRRW
jgi:integrase